MESTLRGTVYKDTVEKTWKVARKRRHSGEIETLTNLGYAICRNTYLLIPASPAHHSALTLITVRASESLSRSVADDSSSLTALL